MLGLISGAAAALTAGWLATALQSFFAYQSEISPVRLASVCSCLHVDIGGRHPERDDPGAAGLQGGCDRACQ